MPAKDLIEIPGEWEEHQVGMVERRQPAQDDQPPVVGIALIRKNNGPMVCSGCGGRCNRYHDDVDREVWDLPILETQTHLSVLRFPMECPQCGLKLEVLTWLERYARMTRRLAQSVAMV